MAKPTAKQKKLIAHITGVMGLAAPEEATEEQLIAFITENGGEAPADTESRKTSSAGDSKTSVDAASGIDMKDRVDILIPKTKETGGSDDVVVGVNGAFFQIKRGIKVNVPVAVVHALNDSIKKDLVEQLNDKGESLGTYEYVDVPAFPFQVFN